MVFQNMALVPRRVVRDNVAFALELGNVDAFTRTKVANETLELVGLEGYGDRMSSELSGGRRGRRLESSSHGAATRMPFTSKRVKSDRL